MACMGPWRHLSTIKAPVSADKYIDESCELVDCAEYTEGVNIVLKFWHGFEPHQYRTTSPVSPMVSLPMISPKDWYDAVILCDENCIANSVFQSNFVIHSNHCHHQSLEPNRNPVTGVTKTCALCSRPYVDGLWLPSIGFAFTRPPWDPNANLEMRPKSGSVLLMWEDQSHTRPQLSWGIGCLQPWLLEETYWLCPVWGSQHWGVCTTDHRLDWKEVEEGCTRERPFVESGFMFLRPSGIVQLLLPIQESFCTPVHKWEPWI